LALGIPRERLFAMQGPCSRALNETLWKDWQIDCVVTKESGVAGGFVAKAQAAYSLGIPLIVVSRPRLNYPDVANDFDIVIDWLQKLPEGRARMIDDMSLGWSEAEPQEMHKKPTQP
jgi:precorrin-3B C17-methyltransferase